MVMNNFNPDVSYDETDIDSILDTMADETEQKVERHHWVNTILGTLSTAFSLTDKEEYNILLRVGRLLDLLRIPERGPIATMRADLATEVVSGYFTDITNPWRNPDAISDDALDETNSSIRIAAKTDIHVPLRLWLTALTGLFTTSYSDFSPGELEDIRRELTYILEGLGLHDEGDANPEKPIRVTNYLTEDVMRSLNQTH